MKSALELAMERMRRLDEEMSPEEKETERRQHYLSQGETLASQHLKDRPFTRKRVESEVQRFPAERHSLVWQGFWQGILAALQIEAPSERAEDVVADWGKEPGQELVQHLHQLRTTLQPQEAQAFVDCMAHFEGQARLQRLAAAGIQVDYPAVARQSRRWHEQQAALRASITAALEEAKASFWGTLFDSAYPNMGKKKC
ncbi:MAG: hypothetical protein HYY20_07310 [Candidatus Tectomicrobia bacterium]|uniref:Uncharacterized protein n=1 Tax=Tectimicrobiota bacterium TaxID=2528274 RepID=A0A932FWN5_UNCTE|nr:hypothetical protein [Candidatus Tectomicrobia bacterium]